MSKCASTLRRRTRQGEREATGSVRSHRAKVLGTGLLLLLALAGSGLLPEQVLPASEAAPGRPVRVPCRVVAGKVVVSCDVSTEVRRIPVNLWLEYDNPSGLRLHNRAAQAVEAETRGGQIRMITLHLPDHDITVFGRQRGPEQAYEDFTRYHSKEIGETALVGSIGGRILSRYHLTLHLKEGYIELAPKKEQELEPEEVLPPEGSHHLEATRNTELTWLTAGYGKGRSGALAISTSRHDSLIDQRLAAALGKPAGDIGPVLLGDLDIARYLAFRPEEVALQHPDGVLGTLGLNFLLHFRVEIDHVNRRVVLEEVAPPSFPEDDLAFFRARAAEDPDELEAFLETYPQARLANEAARLLVDLRLSEDADPEVFARAVTFYAKVQPDDLRTTAMLELMEELDDAGHHVHAVAAGKLGIDTGRDDRYPEAVHKIHSRLGRIQLDRGHVKDAWRHLLSAAFGMPEDGLINYHLGRVYEQQGRLKRAYSRYVQAAIKAESGQQALRALERIQKQMDPDEIFSVDLIERLVGGKILSFSTAARFEADEHTRTNHCALVEFYTNAHFEAGLAGHLAGEGLLSHFPRKRLAYLTYHLPVPKLVPISNELAEWSFQQAGSPGAVFQFNGTVNAPGAGRKSQREELYERARKTVVGILARRSAYTLKLEGRTVDGVVTGKLVVEGPANEDLDVHLVLAERGVLFPGENEAVIHRMLARAPLIKGKPTIALRTIDGRMEIRFERKLSDVQTENEQWLAAQAQRGRGTVEPFATRVDPGQVSLVAFIRHRRTRDTLQAVQVDAATDEETR